MNAEEKNLERMANRRRLTPGCRVSTPLGNGEFRYLTAEDKNRAVIELDDAQVDALTGLKCKGRYVDVLDVLIEGAGIDAPKKKTKRNKNKGE